MNTTRKCMSTGKLLRESLVLLIVAVACNHPPKDPVIVSITPNTAVQGESKAVTINGEFYLNARVSDRDESDSRLDMEFTAQLGDVALENVEYVDFTHLTATVPSTIEPGTYDLTVVDPAGRSGSLAAAFSVTPLELSIYVEDGPDGLGVEIGDLTMHLGQTLSLFAVGRKPDGTFGSNLEATWSVQGDIGVIDVTLGQKAVFTATTIGSGTIVGQHTDSDRDETGVITVIACTQDSDCADPCYSTNTCVDGKCILGAVDKDSDGDGLLDGLCPGGTDCDDDNANCGTDCTDDDGDGYCLPVDCADNPTTDPNCNGLDGTLCNPGLAGSDLCDGADNDCDLSIDEDFAAAASNCGQGVCASTGTLTCVAGLEVDDCSPGAQNESTDITCDGLDGDCDGSTDEDYVPDDSCGVGYCHDANTPSSCSLGEESPCQPAQPRPEGPGGNPTCTDFVDNDCDGLTDINDTDCASIMGKTCKYVTWGSTNGGTLDFSPVANILDPGPAGRTYAQGDWQSAALAQVATYASFGHTENIVKVEAIIAFYLSAPLTDDIVRVQTRFGGVLQGTAVDFPVPALNSHVGTSLAGIEAVDVTSQRTWAWADFDGSLILDVQNVTVDADDAVSIFYDTVGYRVSYDCNNPPIAAFSVTPSGGDTATVFEVDATASVDAEDDMGSLQVRWDWESDGTWDSGFSTFKTANHTYATEGVYTISLEVLDTGGASSFISTPVAVGVPGDVLVVTTAVDETEDPGTGLSFREALALANLGVDDLDVIVFSGPMTILLQSPLPSIKADTLVIADKSVVIDGTNLGAIDDCFAFNGSTTSSLVGLEIRNCPRDGIQLTGIIPIVTVQDCYIHNNGRHGVYVTQLSGQVIGPGNEISANGSSGIAIEGGSALETIIKGNHIHDNQESGIALIVNGAFEPDQTTIRSNEIWANTNAGIDVSNSDDHVIWHNTIVRNGSSGVLFGSDSSGSDLRNNIIVGSLDGHGIDLNGSSIMTLDYNLLYRNSLGPCDGCASQPNSVFLEPLFENGPENDFGLTPTSPAIDTGDDLLVDVNGPAPGNYNGTAPDIGAREAR